MYKIGICDDGKNICSEIENTVLEYSAEKKIQMEIDIWYSGENVKSYLEDGNELDILFLDIELPQINGIEVAEFIRNKLNNQAMEIIYISGKSSYALQLFKTQPLDFLEKPIDQKQIYAVLDTSFKRISQKEKRFEFQKGKEFFYIPERDIIYFCSEGRLVKIFTAKDNYEFYGKLKDVAKNLSDNFILIHHSFIVNKDYIFHYSYESVELSNGISLAISPANRKAVRDKILRDKRI